MLGMAANTVIDTCVFRNTPSSWRTTMLDMGGMALMFVPGGRPLVRASGMVGLHLGARLWDAHDQDPFVDGWSASCGASLANLYRSSPADLIERFRKTK